MIGTVGAGETGFEATGRTDDGTSTSTSINSASLQS